jgi:uncharacterized membrane protein
LGSWGPWRLILSLLVVLFRIADLSLFQIVLVDHAGHVVIVLVLNVIVADPTTAADSATFRDINHHGR